MLGRARDHLIETTVQSTDSMIGMATASHAAIPGVWHVLASRATLNLQHFSCAL
jgi:hypothetical protein